MKHFKLKGGCIAAESLSKYIFTYQPHHEEIKAEVNEVKELQTFCTLHVSTVKSGTTVNVIEDLFERLFLGLTHALTK